MTRLKLVGARKLGLQTEHIVQTVAFRVSGADGIQISAVKPEGYMRRKRWRRGESNPRPVTRQPEYLRA